jgi:rod shape-determining protein MreD
MLSWTLAFLAIEASEHSVLWRDYLQDWLVASVAIAGCLVAGYLFALFAGGAAPIFAIVPQILASMMFFPAVARLCARLDAWRLK